MKLFMLSKPIISEIISIIFIVVLFNGCSNLPSEGDARFAISQKIKNDSESKMELISFRKINAQERETGGVKYYAIEYEAEIKFNEDCKWIARGSLYNQPPRSFKTGPTKMQANQKSGYWGGFMNSSIPGKEYRKGERDKFKSIVIFEYTENGWRHKSN